MSEWKAQSSKAQDLEHSHAYYEHDRHKLTVGAHILDAAGRAQRVRIDIKVKHPIAALDIAESFDRWIGQIKDAQQEKTQCTNS